MWCIHINVLLIIIIIPEGDCVNHLVLLLCSFLCWVCSLEQLNLMAGVSIGHLPFITLHFSETWKKSTWESSYHPDLDGETLVTMISTMLYVHIFEGWRWHHRHEYCAVRELEVWLYLCVCKCVCCHEQSRFNQLSEWILNFGVDLSWAPYLFKCNIYIRYLLAADTKITANFFVLLNILCTVNILKYRSCSINMI